MIEGEQSATQPKNTTTILRNALDKARGLCNNVTLVTRFIHGEECEMDKESVRMVHIRLSPELHKELRVRVAEEDTSIQDWVAALIERELKRGKRK